MAELNYPGLTAPLDHVGAETLECCTSFTVTTGAGRIEQLSGGDNWIEIARSCSRSRATYRRCPTSGFFATFLSFVADHKASSPADVPRPAAAGAKAGALPVGEGNQYR